jgi:hypothetical protein
VEVIADVAVGTQVQVYNLVSRQWQPGVVKDYWEPGGFLEVRCGKRGQQVFSGECMAVESRDGWGEALEMNLVVTSVCFANSPIFSSFFKDNTSQQTCFTTAIIVISLLYS